MFATGPRAVGFTIVWPEGVIFGSIMTYHVQILLLVRQPLFDRAALLLTQTSWVLPPLSVAKMTLRLYGALNYSHGLSTGPSFGTGRDRCVGAPLVLQLPGASLCWQPLDDYISGNDSAQLTQSMNRTAIPTFKLSSGHPLSSGGTLIGRCAKVENGRGSSSARRVYRPAI